MTTEELVALKASIADAKQKYHLLVTGQAIRVFVDQNGERYEYSGTKTSALLAYITSLESQLPGAPSPYAKPIGFIF